jgi:4-amino-4-deoxy-L-arabinose transferase-like glycosyltransferase
MGRATRGAARRLGTYAVSPTTAAIACIVVVSGVLRFWRIDHLGFQIWDEYYFVSGARAIATRFLGVPAFLGTNSLTWHTPPGMSLAIATAYKIFGTAPWVAFLVSATAGTLTVLVCYLLGSQLYSPAVGLLAALLLGISEFSVMYSRMALTDALFVFFMVLSLYLVWRAATARSLKLQLLAGLSIGVLMNIKWNGWYPLFVAGGLLVVDGLASLFSGKRQALAEIGFRFRGLVVMSAVAVLMIVPWLLKVQSAAGFGRLLHVIGAYSVSEGPLLKTPLSVLARYFLLFVGLPTFFLALVGLVLALWEHKRSDWFLLIYAGGFVVLLSIYAPYPHLAYPLLPAVCIWAASGASRLAHLVARMYGFRTFPRITAGVTLMAFVLVMAATEARRLPPLLSSETLGYQTAGQLMNRVQGEALIFIYMQPNSWLYIDSAVARSLAPSVETAQRLAWSGEKVLLLDQTGTWDGRVVDLLSLNEDALRIVEEIPNPMYPEVLLQPAFGPAFDYLSHPPHRFLYITVYRATEPLRIPPSWGLAGS